MAELPLVDRLASAFEPDGADAFRFHGARHESEPELADALYALVHCRLPAEPWARDARGSRRIDAREFTRQLSAANCGTGSWQHGWSVREIEDDGRIVAENAGVRYWCTPAQLRVAGAAPERGERAQVFIPKEYRQLVPGFYMATGDADDDMDGAATVRVYWNVKVAGAVVLVERLTRALNAARIAFRFKTQSDPRNFGRADSSVLYLRRGRFDAAAPLIARVAAAMGDGLDATVPGFARELAPGVAVAEDPGDGSSFGQHRSRLLANALASPRSIGAASPAERAEVVRAMLMEEGYDPGALHLNPGSRDVYAAFDAPAPAHG